MKRRILFSGLIFSALFVFSSYSFYYNDGDKGKLLVQLMMRGMEYHHYAPQEINDQFSATVVEEYLERIDDFKHFLLEEDANQLRAYEDKIDDELIAGSFEMFDLSFQLVNQRVKEARTYMDELLDQPFDFTKDEVYETEYTQFAQDETQLKDRWRKELKFRTISRLNSAVKRQETQKKELAEGEEFEEKTFAELEEEARTQVRKNMDRYFDYFTKLDYKDRRAEYMNTVANIFDPYTNYFPPKEKEQFDIRISGRFEGIGAQLQEIDGYVQVIRIIPGSASSRQGELKPKDRIIRVGQDKESPVDVVGMDLDEIVSMIRGKKGTKVHLSILKPDGTEQQIPIVRDVVELEETYAKSTVIRDKGSQTSIGFIHLPSFYADFRRTGGRNCAEDVAKELQKLKAENVDGVVLDLRYNGGGALDQAIEMTGLFIESGPVVQVKNRDGDTQVYSDLNKNVVYDGPLVVMVNSNSASASEILAAAIQDYDRGIIVGSNSTYGKGTVQRFYNLDDFIRGFTELKPLGQIKLTTSKFYRVNGGATQLKGVTPDIILPNEYNLIETGEVEQDHSLVWDEISPAKYKKVKDGVSMMLPSVKKNSNTRVAQNETFNLISENAQRIKRQQDQTSFPLNFEAYQAYRKNLDEMAEKYKNVRQDIEALEFSFLQRDESFLQSDSSRLDRFESWQKALKKDVYVHEVLQIVDDMTP